MSRILVDASAAFDQRAGVGRYARNIIDRLPAAMPDGDWTLFHAPARPDAGWLPPDQARYVRYPVGRRSFDLLATRLGLPLPIRPFVGRQDLVYSPDFVAPPMRDVPRIVTVHDIAFITHPRLTTRGTAAFLNAAISCEVGRGAMLSAVSNTTRDRIQEHFRLPPERVRVVPNGVDTRFLTALPLGKDRLAELGVPDCFLLMVGTIEPRKNHASVLRVVERRAGEGLPLVVVGRPGWGTDEEVRSLRRLHATGRVVWLDDLADDDLPGLYAASAGALYPSWTEGFGLPVMEALATGRPVVTGNDPVFREIGGDLVIQVDPGDEEALLAAIEEIEALPRDDGAAASRRAHAAQYSWDRSVRMLVAWIREIEEQHR